MARPSVYARYRDFAAPKPGGSYFRPTPYFACNSPACDQRHLSQTGRFQTKMAKLELMGRTKAPKLRKELDPPLTKRSRLTSF